MLLADGADEHPVGLGLHASGTKGHVSCDDSFALENFGALVLGDKIGEALGMGSAGDGTV